MGENGFVNQIIPSNPALISGQTICFERVVFIKDPGFSGEVLVMVIVINRRSVSFFLGTLILFALTISLYNTALHPNMKNWTEERVVISEVKTSHKVVALTFDDGPDPHHTPEVLKVLDKHNVKATFFIIGNRGIEHPQLLKEMSTAGHEVANHSYSHPDFNHYKKDSILEEIRKTNLLITKATGQKPVLFRPPGGYLSYELVDLVRKEKMVIAYWTYQQDSKDWRTGARAERIARHVVANIHPGQIIILHDGCPNGQETARATDLILKALKKQGYRLVTVSQLMEIAEKE